MSKKAPPPSPSGASLARAAQSSGLGGHKHTYDSKVERVEENTCDDAQKTKMAAKESQRSRYGGYLWGDSAAASSDDDDDATGARPLAKGRRVTIGGVAEDSSDDEPQVKSAGGVAGAADALRRSRRWGAYASVGVAADLRAGGEGGLPDGLELVGGEGLFET